ncbi:hypothetical protein QBC41DRAFT_318787 [Cercophora samala]|uniref:C2H2-type domain-containing protein n=1 Tax=Cercophora samala TaxID=330535 RepID=A0AA39ZFD3_9PEZI|nr:hypothetical protein QBC41DRAFT_318787 [Cercophora samala]
MAASIVKATAVTMSVAGLGSNQLQVGDPFEQALEKFKRDLRPKHKLAFRTTTLPDLLAEIDRIQKEQHSSRRLQAVGRLKPALEALNQLGKVVETFTNTSEFVAFVWGPLKLLIQIASSFAEAFTELLSVYESLGEELPLVLQYEVIFSDDGNMKRVLAYLYKDVLEFHHRAMKYFQQPMWRQLFQATWKTYKSRFDDLISGIKRHRELIVSQANLLRIEASLDDRRNMDQHFSQIAGAVNQASLSIQSSLDERKIRDQQFKEMADAESNRKLRDLHGWLKATNVANDQHEFSRLRSEYPGTGSWILDNPKFKEWFETPCQLIPPVLWLNGIPGAGKTILASLVVDQAQQLSPLPVVLYFFCKQGDDERDNFNSIARSLLSQLLPYNRDILLPFYYDKYQGSTEAVLETRSIIEDLLKVSIQNFPQVYIILDGIDECPRKERDIISSWFRELVENLPQSNPTQVRCLFVSQEDGISRKNFAGVSVIKIRSQDNQRDIEQYSAKWANDIQKKFELSDNKRESIAKRIVDAAGGMFLLAKLISTNLLHQLDVDELEYELEPGRFPREINAAYSRIIVRIFDHVSESEQHGSRMLLSWLVCAKRSLKWHEIQGAKSIDLEIKSVDFRRLRFRVDSKDLCGSLVEIRSDGTVELVHLTAKLFLISEKHVNPARGDLQLASLCLSYLNFPIFTDDLEPKEQDSLIVDGSYAFMDYAIIYWVRHLEASSACLDREDTDTRDISDTLEDFIELHYTTPATRFPVSQGNATRLSCFGDLECHDRLQQAVISTRKQLTFYGEIDKAEIALDLVDIVEKVRAGFERLLIGAQNGDGIESKMEKHYGSNLFKCPRLSCKFFANGFATAEQRNQHLGKHQRPFRCTVEGCLSGTTGMTSEKELQKHMKETHVGHQSEDEFPDDYEVARSLQPPPSNTGASDVPELQEFTVPEVAPVQAQEQDEPASRDAANAKEQFQPRLVHIKQKQEHRCQFCDKVFTRKFNLDSHLVTHSEDRPWKCHACSKSFARESDLSRHSKGHDEGNSFGCQGCGKKFARRDTLANHHKSKLGKRCLSASASQRNIEQSSPSA